MHDHNTKACNIFTLDGTDCDACTPQTEKWKNYRMYDYVTKELPALLASDPAFGALDTKTSSIMGHSMGGHGK